MKDLRSRYRQSLRFYRLKGQFLGLWLILVLPIFGVAQDSGSPSLGRLRQIWYSKDKKMTDTQRWETYEYLIDWYKPSTGWDSVLILAQEMMAYGKQHQNADFVIAGLRDVFWFQIQEGNFHAAIRTCHEALPQPGLSHSNDFFVIYRNLGIAHRNLEQLDSAAYYFKRALASCQEKNQSPLEIGVINRNLAGVYAKQGKYLDAIDTYKQVPNVDDFSYMFKCAVEIAGVFKTLNLPNEARVYYQRADVFAKQSNEKPVLIRNYAAQLEICKNLKQAEQLIQKGLALHDSFGLKRHTLVLFLEAGALYLDSLKLDRATDFYQRALALTINTEDKGFEITALLALAKIHQLQGRTQQSMQICQDISPRLKKNHIPRQLVTFYDILSKNYEALQKPAQALFYLRQKEAQVALLNDEENIKAALRAYIQRKSEKERSALKQAKNHAEKLAVATQAQAQLNYSIFGLISLVLMGAVGAYYYFYQQKKSAAEHLSALNQSLVLEKLKLTKTNAKLRRFSGIVSHDILSNLDLILSTGNLLVGTRPNPQSLNQYYTMTQTTSRQLKDYCLGLLADTRSAQKEDLTPEEWADPMPVLHRVLARFGPELRAAGMEVDLQELSPVPLPEVLMEQIFQNLISNALRHGATVPQARLLIREDADQQGQIRWIIKDNGPGVTPEQRETIFEPKQERSGPGQRVGLSLLRAALREQGADIRVEAAAEGGASWIVAMP